MFGSNPTLGTRTLTRHFTYTACALGCLLALLVPGEIRSQTGCISLPVVRPDSSCWSESPHEPTRSPGHLLALGVNGALGGLTAGIAQAWQGASFWKGFVRGAAGGSVAYSGKWTSSQVFFGSGFLGREVAAVGASMVINASEGLALLDRVVLPVGPVRLYVDRAAPAPLRARLDLPGAISTVYTAAQGDTELDWASTLSSGAPVFTTTGERSWLARHAAGVITVRDRQLSPETRREEMGTALRHERIHLVQYDFSAIVWGEPAERWLLTRAPYGVTLHRHATLGVDQALWGGIRFFIPYDQQPWEWEARLFTGQ